MKCIKTGTICILLLLFGAALSHAIAETDTIDSHEVLAFLLGLSAPEPPQIIDNMLVFTACSSLRRVGIAFADEGFSRVHWFRPLMVADDPLARIRLRRAPAHRDSGIAFHAREIPDGATHIEYRLIVNGLWTTDPANPNTRRDGISGSTMSVVSIPRRPQTNHPLRGQFDGLHFVFRGPPGETVTVAGSFNAWDPFMYELREGPPGTYSIQIPLPPGRHQYVFFHRGERVLDPYNPARVFSREGLAASEVVIP